MKIYADTSVFGGVFNARFAENSQTFFDAVRAGRYQLVVSDLVEKEIRDAPKQVKAAYQRTVEQMEIAELTPEAANLRDAYLAGGVVTAKSAADATHVAMTTTLGCAAIVSWNFKHIANPDKARQYNDINRANGYNPIQIITPTELIAMSISEPDEVNDFDEDEPDCVKWKRAGQRRIREETAGMTREEEMAYWRKVHQRALADQAEARRRQPEIERKLGIKSGEPGYTARLVEAIEQGRI